MNEGPGTLGSHLILFPVWALSPFLLLLLLHGAINLFGYLSRLIIQMQSTPKTGLISDQRMLQHRSCKNHPEAPLRLTTILHQLQLDQFLKHPHITYQDNYSRMATDEDIGAVYPQQYIEYVKGLWPKHSHRSDITILDTFFGEHSNRIARLSAGGVLQGIDRVMDGSWKNGFALIRPPGHHSGVRNTINGFCVFNNVAVGARYVQRKYGLKRVAILDYDIHQGDGTHRIFSKDPSVLFISVHRHDRGAYYPSGSGANYPACGQAEAEGSKLNIPLNTVDKSGNTHPFQTPGDNQYIYLYDRIIHPILYSFDPEFILVSSGFDAARWDPVGGFTATPNAYYYMTRRLTELKKPMLCVLEGGYNFRQTALATSAVVSALLGDEKLPEPIEGLEYADVLEACHVQQAYHQDLDQIIEHHAKYWKALNDPLLISLTNKIKSNKDKLFGVIDTSEPPLSQAEALTYPIEDSPSESTTQFYFAAGHMQRFKNLSTSNDRILKWAYPEQRIFYQSNFPQAVFAPSFYGSEGEYIVIENVLYQHSEPIVLDIKLSRQSKNPNNNPVKVAKQEKKEVLSTSHKYAFRIGGFTTPNYKEGGLLINDEEVSRKILRKVVTAQNKGLFCSFLKGLAAELRKVRRHYYGTSILLVRGKDKSSVKWVDFHYWYEECQDYDRNLVEGVENLQKFIEGIVA